MISYNNLAIITKNHSFIKHMFFTSLNVMLSLDSRNLVLIIHSSDQELFHLLFVCLVIL